MWVVGTIDYLVAKLQRKFPTHGVMDSFGVVYPQYWLQFDAKESFHNHLDVIKATICHPKKLGNSDIVWVLKVLSTTSFSVQQSIVKMAMKSNVGFVMAKLHDMSSLMHLQCTLSTSIMFTCSFVEYFKLAKITMVQVLSRIKNVSYLNFSTCCKSKLCN